MKGDVSDAMKTHLPDASHTILASSGFSSALWASSTVFTIPSFFLQNASVPHANKIAMVSRFRILYVDRMPEFLPQGYLI
jgi:hypothetical protein